MPTVKGKFKVKGKNSSMIVVPLEQVHQSHFILVMQNQENFIELRCGLQNTADSV
jgi:hypothetical protein